MDENNRWRSKTNKSMLLSTKVKSLVQLFKGGGSPEGGAIWSLLASSEISLLTVNAIKDKADCLEIPKAACTVSSKPCK